MNLNPDNLFLHSNFQQNYQPPYYQKHQFMFQSQPPQQFMMGNILF